MQGPNKNFQNNFTCQSKLTGKMNDHTMTISSQQDKKSSTSSPCFVVFRKTSSIMARSDLNNVPHSTAVFLDNYRCGQQYFG
mmetsp:Transcript_48136/g.116869  ORF Transcript_48136/g.116869 Transcript_48136/m.116869 type:complete len:82 (-) Transcript_48136:204-449(-)